MDYARLVMNRWDQGAGELAELQVFGPPPTARMTDLLFSPEGVYGPDIEARTRHRCSLDVYEARGGAGERARPDPEVREVGPGDVVEGKGWRVTVGEGWHFQPYLQCLAYRIDTDAGSICYSGDSGRRVPRHRRTGAGRGRADPHEPFLLRHRALAGIPPRLRQPYGHGAGGGRGRVWRPWC